MNYENIIGVLELGTEEIKCVIAQLKEEDDFEIIGTSIKHSKGIHNGVVVNLSEATNAIRSCLSDAEKKIQCFS